MGLSSGVSDKNAGAVMGRDTMELAEPRLSVITPNYNHGHLIAEAVRSVGRQTRAVFEHIVVDDASTDNSVEVLETLRTQYPRLHLLTSSRNAGPIAACSRGVSEARGDVLMFLAADDAVLPDAADALLQIFDLHPDAALVTGDVRFVSQADGSSWRRRLNLSSRSRYFSPEEVVANQRKGTFVISGASSMVRRDAAIRAGIEEQGLRWHHDWFAFNVIAYRHGLWYVPRVVHEFKVSPLGHSWGSRNWSKQEAVLDRLFELLDRADYHDVRDSFRNSGALAYLPFIARYIRRPRARAYATPRLITNLVLMNGYRALSRVVPRAALEKIIRLKSPRGWRRD